MRACSHRTAIVLGIWMVLALVMPAAITLASQSSMRPTVYLPLVLSVPTEPSPVPSPQPVRPSSVFGLVMTSIRPERGLDGALELGITWIRSNENLLWRDVEPVEGAGYQWNAPSVQRVEQEMIRASQNNLQLIMIVRASPRWATTPYQADCAPINPSKYTRFAAFLAAAVARYSQPPYNVLLWQVGNEPDADLFPRDSGFGCWGIKTDPYYGGRAYGEMLKVVYPAMKTANPAVQVLHGSLLLSNPYNPNGSNVSGRFIEGVFLAGAANSFDILAYNAYVWTDKMNNPDWKTSYLRGLMTTYQVPLKPMIITEQALLCDPACPKLQAYVVGRYYARALTFNLLGSMWYIYDSDGFHYTALVEPSNILQRRPAYYAYKYAATLLKGASSLGPLTGQPSGVEGYRFAQPTGETLIVLWSNKAQGVAIPVDASASVTCTGWDGAALPCSNEAGLVQLTADLGTIYVIAR